MIFKKDYCISIVFNLSLIHLCFQILLLLDLISRVHSISVQTKIKVEHIAQTSLFGCSCTGRPQQQLSFRFRYTHLVQCSLVIAFYRETNWLLMPKETMFIAQFNLFSNYICSTSSTSVLSHLLSICHLFHENSRPCYFIWRLGS